MTTQPPRALRAEPREIAELRALAARQPELHAAAMLQIELLESQRRVQSRLSTSWIDVPAEILESRLQQGTRLLDFARLPVDWTEVRLLFRQITDILRRYEAVEPASAAGLHALGRGPDLPAAAERWYNAVEKDAPASISTPEMLDEVLSWSLRPFLARASEVLIQRVSFEGWHRGHCPVCGGEPEFAVLTSAGGRVLCCGRCQARWPFDSVTCPFCNEASHDRITSFATPDGTYRVTACKTCGRYLKALDGRRAQRPVLPGLDTIATLPLDAVVMQKGFGGGG